MSATKTDNKAQGAAQASQKAGGMNLSGMDLSGLMSAPVAPQKSTGPLRVPLDRVREDPAQPRTESNPGFSPEKIAEIGGTIKSRGVKTPISVHDDLELGEGHYIINDGARRYRGSKWAGVPDIPVFVDNDYVGDDQIVANIQKEDHTPRELAYQIKKRLDAGMKKGDIAKAWGKSNAFITQYAALLTLPDVIAVAFDADRVNDITVVNELVTAYKKNPEEVAAWLSDETQEITRGSVKLLREFLEDSGGRDPHTVDAFNGHTDAEGGDEEEGGDETPTTPKKPPKEEDPTRIKKAIVQVEINGDLCRLIQTKRPTEIGLAWFKNEVNGDEFEHDMTKAKMVALVEA